MSTADKNPCSKWLSCLPVLAILAGAPFLLLQEIAAKDRVFWYSP